MAKAATLGRFLTSSGFGFSSGRCPAARAFGRGAARPSAAPALTILTGKSGTKAAPAGLQAPRQTASSTTAASASDELAT
jgi:hypothetical protein